MANRFNGAMGKGARRIDRELKRQEAEERQSKPAGYRLFDGSKYRVCKLTDRPVARPGSETLALRQQTVQGFRPEIVADFIESALGGVWTDQG